MIRMILRNQKDGGHLTLVNQSVKRDNKRDVENFRQDRNSNRRSKNYIIKKQVTRQGLVMDIIKRDLENELPLSTMRLFHKC